MLPERCSDNLARIHIIALSAAASSPIFLASSLTVSKGAGLFSAIFVPGPCHLFLFVVVLLPPS